MRERLRRLRPALAGLVVAGLPAGGWAEGAPAGDPTRGAALVASRSQSQCVLCHAVPGVPPHLWGDVGPSLAGVGDRLTVDELRARLEAPERFNPDTVMPSYTRTDGLTRVAVERQGRPLFNAQQLADVVAYLARLK